MPKLSIQELYSRITFNFQLMKKSGVFLVIINMQMAAFATIQDKGKHNT